MEPTLPIYVPKDISKIPIAPTHTDLKALTHTSSGNQRCYLYLDMLYIGHWFELMKH